MTKLSEVQLNKIVSDAKQKKTLEDIQKFFLEQEAENLSDLLIRQIFSLQTRVLQTGVLRTVNEANGSNPVKDFYDLLCGTMNHYYLYPANSNTNIMQRWCIALTCAQKRLEDTSFLSEYTQSIKALQNIGESVSIGFRKLNPAIPLMGSILMVALTVIALVTLPFAPISPLTYASILVSLLLTSALLALTGAVALNTPLIPTRITTPSPKPRAKEFSEKFSVFMQFKNRPVEQSPEQAVNSSMP